MASSSKKVRASRAKVRRRPVKGASVRRWVRRARGKGLTGAELVYELHVRRGMALPKVARVLRLGLEVVRRHWRRSCAERARAARPAKPMKILPVLAPQSEGDLVALREQVCVALWETVVGTFAVPEGRLAVVGEVADAGRAALSSPLMLSVRVRALRQMARLYDVDCKGRAAAAAVVPGCATREEIAEGEGEGSLKFQV